MHVLLFVFDNESMKTLLCVDRMKWTIQSLYPDEVLGSTLTIRR